MPLITNVILDIPVKLVGKSSKTIQNLYFIAKFTPISVHMNATYVGKPSNEQPQYAFINVLFMVLRYSSPNLFHIKCVPQSKSERFTTCLSFYRMNNSCLRVNFVEKDLKLTLS